MGSKICTKCGGSGPFTVDRQKKDGLRPWCKACDKARLNSDQSRYILLLSTAKTRRIKCDLTFEQYIKVLDSEARRCHYCGGDLPRRGYGVDRCNSHGWYTVGNVVPCCARCNTAKGQMGQRKFLEWIADISDWGATLFWHPIERRLEL